MATLVSNWSKDPSRKSGCILIDDLRAVLSVGYNGFPREVEDRVENVPQRFTRPDKYKWTEHAERNAIYNASRRGIPLSPATAYINWFPCADCTRALIQSGIERVVCGAEPDFNDPTYGRDFLISSQMMIEANIKIECLPVACPKQV
jgi:dCMP deaminase